MSERSVSVFIVKNTMNTKTAPAVTFSEYVGNYNILRFLFKKYLKHLRLLCKRARNTRRPPPSKVRNEKEKLAVHGSIMLYAAPAQPSLILAYPGGVLGLVGGHLGTPPPMVIMRVSVSVRLCGRLCSARIPGGSR
jgi:hypothetical protein